MAALTVAASCLALLGIILALTHVVVLLPAALRQGGDTRPDLIPWGYIGVGLLTALVGWLGGRLLTGGRLLPIDDAVGFVLVLAMASWGFGSAYDWWEARRQRQIPWATPLAVSLLLGFTLGLSALNP